jgi:2-polyprenyl-3-methyl-5-hydroxy-6-metoxy-1,4-benzoquinol methylase
MGVSERKPFARDTAGVNARTVEVGRCTTDTLLERYHTLTRRDAGLDPRSRRTIFQAFARTVGPWLPNARNSPLLEIGCGEGHLLAFLKDAGYTDLAGFDLSPENVELCHKRGLTFVQDHDALRLQDFCVSNQYKVIFCLDLIEHLPKEQAVPFLRQAFWRLLPSGYVVIQAPNMGSVLGLFHRYADLSHEYGLTERTAVTLLMAAGFQENRIEVRPAWNATTLLGHARELYLRGLHSAVWLAEGRMRPRIPTRNLLIRASK